MEKPTLEKKNPKKEIGIFIDGDNIESKFIEVILEEVKIHGNINFTNVYYNDIENSKKWINTCDKYNLNKNPVKNIPKKNSTDISLSIDIMECMCDNPDISLYYIVSGDRDFLPIIKKIKIRKKTVHVIGKKNTHEDVKEGCDLYKNIEILYDEYKEKERIRIEKEQIKREKEQIKRDREQIKRDKEQIKRDKEQIKRDKEQLELERRELNTSPKNDDKKNKRKTANKVSK